ncbi:hypothetical protein [Solidesulfovibrio sp.]
MDVSVGFVLGLVKSTLRLIYIGVVRVFDPRSTFWESFFEKMIVVVADKESDECANTVMYDAMGCFEFRDKLANIGLVKNIEFVFSRKYGGQRSSNLLLVGGPKANFRTKMVFDNLKKNGNKHYCFDNFGIIQHCSRGAWAPSYNGESIAIDWAVVTCIDNIFDKRFRMVICSGIHGFATMGALRFLSDKQSVGILIQELKERCCGGWLPLFCGAGKLIRGKSYQFILKVEVVDSMPVGVSLESGSLCFIDDA